jgi:hypothetical protein
MPDGKSAGDLLTIYVEQSVAGSRLFLVFGKDSPKDRVRAESLGAVVPAQLIPICDPSEPVGHNALYPLAKQGKLVEFLESTVFDATSQH